MASVRARAWYTDEELLEMAALWHARDPRIAWQWREAWAIRCVDGKEEDVGEAGEGQTYFCAIPDRDGRASEDYWLV